MSSKRDRNSSGELKKAGREYTGTRRRDLIDAREKPSGNLLVEEEKKPQLDEKR